ncbi:hypothetical protein IKQ21_06995 [bacterium]|nr:hypothetical protein [bacterium]
MRISTISGKDTVFGGKIIFPENMSPKLQDFKEAAEHKLSSFVKNQPSDVFITESKVPDGSEIRLMQKVKGKINPIAVMLLLETEKRPEEVVLLKKASEDFDKLAEQMEIIKQDIEKSIEERLCAHKRKNKIHSPKTIGRNSQLNNKSKNFNKRIRRGGI